MFFSSFHLRGCIMCMVVSCAFTAALQLIHIDWIVACERKDYYVYWKCHVYTTIFCCYFSPSRFLSFRFVSFPFVLYIFQFPSNNILGNFVFLVWVCVLLHKVVLLLCVFLFIVLCLVLHAMPWSVQVLVHSVKMQGGAICTHSNSNRSGNNVHENRQNRERTYTYYTQTQYEWTNYIHFIFCFCTQPSILQFVWELFLLLPLALTLARVVFHFSFFAKASSSSLLLLLFHSFCYCAYCYRVYGSNAPHAPSYMQVCCYTTKYSKNVHKLRNCVHTNA